MTSIREDIRNKTYTVEEASEILGISTSSVNELKRRLGTRPPDSKRYIIKRSDISKMYLIVWKIEKLYGVVTLSTINEFYGANNGEIHKPTPEELEDLFRHENQ
jgi:hypothetical protein